MQGNLHDEEFEHIDADAVCEACSNVNPPGTLLCKVCGNNLRDQRTRRLQAGGPVEVAAPRFQIARVLWSILTVVGLFAILWTALNVPTIEQWLTTGFAAAEENTVDINPESYWTGPDAPVFENLGAMLDSNPLTIQQASLTAPGAPKGSFDGLYILKRSTRPEAIVLGSAAIVTEGDNVHFLARLSGGTEVRGTGQKTSEHIARAITVGIRYPDGTYDDGYGFAEVQPTGELVCTGLYGAQEWSADAIAIPIPPGLLAGAAPEPEPVAETESEAVVEDEAAAPAESESTAPA